MTEEKDDEISIDTRKSKISSIPENSEDEFSLDFSKIKGLFKKKKSETPKESYVENIETGIKEHSISNLDQSSTQVNTNQEVISKSNEPSKQEPVKIETSTKDPEKKDDEIVIDFSWFKNIFKKSGSEDKEKVDVSKTDTSENSDDEVSIDFSKLKKIKNIFKKSDDVKESDDDISIDYKKVGDFFVKYRIFFLLIIPILLSVFLRIQPAYLPVTDEWAANSVIGGIRSQIRGQIDQQYPNLPGPNKDALAQNELEKVLQEQSTSIDQQITATSNFFKSKLQDDTGQTYLLAIDPYFWMRHAKNVIDNGHPGDKLEDNYPYDTHMYAPGGRGLPIDMFHAYFEAFLFKLVSIFNKNPNLMAVIFYIPVIISALAVIPAFFITRKLGGNLGGLVAAVIVAIHPSFLTRTAGGFADTDAYNVMFPLFIAWIFLEALDAKNFRSNLILSSAAGLLVGVYSFTWGGWWYIFDFILASTGLYVAYYAFVHRGGLLSSFQKFVKQKAVKNSIIFLLTFFIVTAVCVTIFINFSHFTQFYTSPTGFAKLKEVGITTIWPNVFTTVAEQNPASLNDVINQVGLRGSGFFDSKIPLFFLISLMGITLTLATTGHKKFIFILGTLIWFIIIFLTNVQNLNTFLILISIPIVIRILIALWESDKSIDIKYSIFLILWFIATIFASTKGVRFTLLLVPAFAIGFGIAIGQLYGFVVRWIVRGLHINKLIAKITFIVLIVVLLVAPFNSAKRTAEQEIPSFNDAWKISLERIKEDSKPDAIINSWWDFGHWFKFWADRPVTFDGTSQNTPQAHWIGKTLLTDDEDLAVGILRLLDCSGGAFEGGTTVFAQINEKTKDGSKTIDLLNDIMVLGIEDAEEYLQDIFSSEETDDILSQTHCQPPEDYFITSEDMVGKSGVWAHFGSWDFERGLIYNTLKKKEFSSDIEKSVQFLQERFGMTEEDAENSFYEVQSITSSSQANDWIAPWPGYAGEIGCSRKEDILGCDNGFIINLTSQEAFAQSQDGIVHPKIISIPTDEGIDLIKYNESVITLSNGRNLGFTLIKEGENYRMLQMDSDLTASMFTRLFYQNGIGLSHFKKFSDERSVFGGRIIVWKVDWEGKEKNVILPPEPEDAVDEVSSITDDSDIVVDKNNVENESLIDVNESQPPSDDETNNSGDDDPENNSSNS